MNSQKILSIVVAVLGLLMTCCLCPLVLHMLVFIGTSGGKSVSLYSEVFSARLGNLSAATLVIAAQSACTTSLALIVFIIGIVMFALAMRSSK